MIILGIETSCDETAAAVLQNKHNRIQILSNVVASSSALQAKYGGIIPEQAAREQIKSIIPVIEESLRLASLAQGSSIKLDAIAVTYGPGLIGSLLVGVETAKTLSSIWNKPLIPVNHLLGHFYANFIQRSAISLQLSDKKQKKSDDRRLMTDDYPSFPCIGLLVSGGHTDLVLFTGHGKYKYLGGTRDDAAGECFDKCARLLGLSYPGGPEISKLAEGGKDTYKLPRPMMDSKNFDFSFSGLKTAVANLVQSSEFGVRSKNSTNYQLRTNNLAASVEAAIVDVLVEKTLRAVKRYKVKQLMVAGGVAANKNLVDRLQVTVDRLGIKLHVPPPELCTDNGAMIASAAFFSKPIKNPLDLAADPNLSLDT